MIPEDFATWLGAGFFPTLLVNLSALAICWLFSWGKKFLR
jgi:hypothetical protein